MARLKVDSSGKVLGSGNRGAARAPAGHKDNNNMSHVFELVEFKTGETENRWTPENNEGGDYDHAVVKLVYPIGGIGKKGDEVKLIIPALAGGKKNNGIFGMTQKVAGKPAIKPGDLIHVDNINDGYVSNKFFNVSKGSKVDALVGQYAGIEVREAQLKSGSNAFFHGPMTVTPVRDNGERGSSQTIRMYHADNSEIVPSDSFTPDESGDGEVTPDEISALDHKNIDAISEVIKKVLKNPQIELGTPGVMLRAIGNVSGHSEAEAAKLLKDDENASPISFNVVGYVPSKKDADGNTVYSKPEDANAESVIAALKNAYDSGMSAYIANEKGEELDAYQKRQLSFFKGIADVLERASDTENFIIEVIPTSTLVPSGPKSLFLEGGKKSKGSIASWPFQAATRIHAEDENGNAAFGYLPMTGITEGNATTAIRRTEPTYDGKPIPEDYTVLPNGLVLDENGEKLGKSEPGKISAIYPNSVSATVTNWNKDIAPPSYVATKALEVVSPNYKKLFTLGTEIVSESRKKLAEINREARENEKEQEHTSENDGVEP